MKKKFRLKTRFKLLLMFMGAAVVVLTLFMQKSKLAQISAEKSALEAQVSALTNETQRYEQMVEYAKTEEAIQSEAREKLGFVKPGDLVFKVQE